MASKDEALKLYEQAMNLFRSRNLEEAFQAFREAGVLFRTEKDYEQAMQSFGMASECEKIRAGIEPLLQAADMSEHAAGAAVLAGRFADAKWYYREAGLLFEKEGEFEKYSHCFVGSQDTHLRFLWHTFHTGRKQQRAGRPETPVTMGERLESLTAWVLGLASRFVWKYGEEPLRPLLTAVLIILGCGLLYFMAGPVDIRGMQRPIGLSEAFYMSAVTFTTVGYGDLVPVGWVRWISVFEAFSGIVLMPLFLISLTRRYLRVYR